MGRRKLRNLRQRTFENVLYMLESRGFDLEKGAYIDMERNSPRITSEDFTEYLGMTDQEFNESFPEDEDLMILSGIFRNPKTNKKLLTYFNEDAKINKDFIRKLASFAESLRCQEILLVYKSNFTADAKKEFTSDKSKMSWEALSYDQMATNLSKSPFTPIHQLVPADQEASVLERHSISDRKKVARIEESDIVAIWYGFKVGDLIMITRRDAGLGGSVKNEIEFRTVFPEKTKAKKATVKVQGVKMQVEEVAEEEDQEDLNAVIAAEFGAEF